MKKIKIFFLLSILLLLITSCGKENTSLKKINFEVMPIEYVNKSEFYNYSITIPQIKDEKTEDISYFNMTMQENMRYIVENLSTSKDDGGIQEANMNYEVKENNFDILSIVILTSTYTGGAHGANNLEAYNIYLKDSTLISFDKIFNEEAEEFFNMSINDTIRNKEKVLNTRGKEVIFFENAEADIKNATMYFEGDNIVFVFSEYDLSPYSSGMPVFKFNKKLVKKYMN